MTQIIINFFYGFQLLFFPLLLIPANQYVQILAYLHLPQLAIDWFVQVYQWQDALKGWESFWADTDLTNIHTLNKDILSARLSHKSYIRAFSYFGFYCLAVVLWIKLEKEDITEKFRYLQLGNPFRTVYIGYDISTHNNAISLLKWMIVFTLALLFVCLKFAGVR